WWSVVVATTVLLRRRYGTFGTVEKHVHEPASGGSDKIVLALMITIYIPST
ncbi:6633_t:CDS:2, partial [Paraglomus occultum]